MIKSLQSYFKFRGWKTSANKPSDNTATGKLSHEVWDNMLSPSVSYLDAVQELLKMKEEINQKSVEKKRCGLYATELVRDKSCERCGMTNNEHLTKWNERLHIDHINNDGRHNQRLGLKPNNDISNLQILCRSCHVKKDNQTKDYNKQSVFAKEEIDKIISMAKESKSIRKFAMELGYNYGTIYSIVKGKNLKRFNSVSNENN